MRRPFTKPFRNKNRLITMLSMRENGWSYTGLALVYGVDHSSIYHECKKFNVGRKSESVDFSIKSILSGLEIRVPQERTYAEYLEESKRLSQLPSFRN